MIDFKLLKNEERAIIALRSLYNSYGYLPYKMSKFEEYDMYVKTKDFLVSDRIITFAGTDGKLLALKPDVTMSILKSTKFEKGVKNRFYYNENVYRPSGSTGQYKEIMQTGVENIGDLDISDIFEVIILAASSLNEISDEFVLDLSHMGVISAVLDLIGCNNDARKNLINAISSKSCHLIRQSCEEYNISGKFADVLCKLVSIDGSICYAADALSGLFTAGAPDAVKELRTLAELIADTEYSDKIRLDFSMAGNMNYYNGISFCGYIPGVCERVLSGGEYGGLLGAMGVSGRGIGFAVYLDLLSEVGGDRSEYDVDVLLVYDENTDISLLNKKQRELRAEGKTVCAQCSDTVKIRYTEKIDLR